MGDCLQNNGIVYDFQSGKMKNLNYVIGVSGIVKLETLMINWRIEIVALEYTAYGQRCQTRSSVARYEARHFAYSARPVPSRPIRTIVAMLWGSIRILKANSQADGVRTNRR